MGAQARVLSFVQMLFLAAPWLVVPLFGPSTRSAGLLFAWGGLASAMLAIACRSETHAFFLMSNSVRRAWLLAALLSSMFAVCQYFGFAPSLSPWVSSANLGEAFANLRQRNQFATLTNIGLAAVLWRTVSYEGSRSWPIASWAIALLAIANAASGSRTGLVQLLLLMALSFAWRGRAGSTKKGAGLALLCYAIAALALPWLAGLPAGTGGIWGRLQEDVPVCSSRLTLWSNVLHLIAQKPWLGWGWGELDYAHFITLYPGARFCDILDNAHNLPLHLAVELGVPFALLACGLCGWWIVRAKPWREVHPTRQLAWAVLALIGLHSLLEYPLWYGPFQMTVVLCLLLLWTTPRSAAISESESHLQLLNVVRKAVPWGSAMILAACIYVGWQYWRVSQIYLPQEQRAAGYKTDTLQKIQDNVLFRDQVRFAELTTAALSSSNALAIYDLAKDLLHFSPEPRVVQALIESSLLLGRDAEAAFYLQRFKAAFPKEYAAWRP